MKKRAIRRHHRHRVAANRRKLMKAREGVGDRYINGPSRSETLSDNELAERHPYDCGKRCFMCHGDKLLDSSARRQRMKREAAIMTAEALDLPIYIVKDER